MKTEQELWLEADKAMEQFKADNPDVDWDTHEVYAVLNNQTQTLERVGYMTKKIADNMNGTPRG